MIFGGNQSNQYGSGPRCDDLARSSSEPYLFNHVMRSWLFGILLSEDVKPSPDPELLAVSTVLHDLGLTEHYMAEERFEVDGANAARAFMKERVSQRSRCNLSGMRSPFTPLALSLSTKNPKSQRPIQVLRWTLSGLVSIEFRRINYRRSSRSSLAWHSRTSSSHPYATSFAANRRPALTTFFGFRHPLRRRVQSPQLRRPRRKLSVF